MSPMKLTPRREAIIELLWQVLSLGWLLAVIVLVFSGLIEILPGWALGVVLGIGLLVTLLIVVEIYVDSSPTSVSDSSAMKRSGSDEVTR